MNENTADPITGNTFNNYLLHFAQEFRIFVPFRYG